MMKIATALFTPTAVAPLPAAADCGVSNFKIKDNTNNNDERILRKHAGHKKIDVDEENAPIQEGLMTHAPGTNPSFHPCEEGLSLDIDSYANVIKLQVPGYPNLDLTCGDIKTFLQHGMVDAGTYETYLKVPFEENCECVDPTMDTPRPAPTPPPMTKSGKTPDHGHGEECALDVLQRAEMFTNYMFELLDENQDNEVTSDEFCKLVDAETEDDTISFELQAAIAIGGEQAVQALIGIGSACSIDDFYFDPVSKTEFEIASVLYYCDNDPSALIFLRNRGTNNPFVGAACLRFGG